LSLVRSGGDLLSHVLRRSTIGVAALIGRVRDGIGSFAAAMATRPEKRQAVAPDGGRGAVPDVIRDLAGPKGYGNISVVPGFVYVLLTFPEGVGCVISRTLICLAVSGSDQANRAISTSQLNALLRLHLWPIDVVVFHGPQGRPCFEGGFPLRCLQRLSCPNIATQHCRWHDNWSTSGSFNPVLSY
jgi:hypothetical protein